MDRAARARRIGAALLVVALTAVADFGGWWWFNRPQPLAVSFDQPFPSVSYSPTHRGPLLGLDESALFPAVNTPAGIEADLKRLAGITTSVRIYGAGGGLEVVPGLARKYGLQVTQGAWLGPRLDADDREVALAIKAANAYPDVITRVIVGNEVLLRKELSPAQIIGYIRKVRAAVRQPVSYADVWVFWLQHPEIAEAVDFITIHILPYWEDEPVGVDDAARHVVDIWRIIHRRFPGKPILIGEAGWPTRGRERGAAIPSRVNAARFVRTLARLSRENGFDTNLIEGFDQAWKAGWEGTAGANWGILDDSGRVKVRMSGPVMENPGWAVQGAVAALLGGLGALWLLGRSRGLPLGRTVAAAGMAQLLAVLAVCQAVDAWGQAYDLAGAAFAALRIGLQAWMAVLVLEAAGAALAGTGAGPGRRLGRLVQLYGLAAVAATLLLLVDGRYRDIPTLEFLVPCLGVAAYGLLRAALPGLRWDAAFAAGGLVRAREMTVALWLAVAAAPLSEAVALARGADFRSMHPTLAERLPLLAHSLVANRAMLAWAAMLAVLSLPFLAEWRRLARAPATAAPPRLDRAVAVTQAEGASD